VLVLGYCLVNLYENREELSAMQVGQDLSTKAAEKAKFRENLGQGTNTFGRPE
jgi:hypothetical protein